MSARPSTRLALSFAILTLGGCAASANQSDGSTVDPSDSSGALDAAPDRGVPMPVPDAAADVRDGSTASEAGRDASGDVLDGDSTIDAFVADARADAVATDVAADADADADAAADASTDVAADATADAGRDAAPVVCPSGQQDNDHDNVCLPSCAAGTCSMHGVCSDATGTAVCACSGGYTGSSCSACASGTQDNDHNGTCTAVCTATTCAHGTCSDATGTVACTCTGNYSGTLCDTCPSGAQDNDHNGTCLAACTASSCTHGTCSDATGAPVCTCTGNYTGTQCDTCPSATQDNDHDGMCTAVCTATTCLHGTCSDASGTTACTCTAPFTGTLCDTCPSGTQDNDHNGTCLTACTATSCTHGTCSDATGAPVCTCTGNYTGTLCDTCPNGTQDNDHNGTCTASCVAGQCGTNGTCADSSGTAACSCGVPYGGVACATSCYTRDTYANCTPDGNFPCNFASNGSSYFSYNCLNGSTQPYCTNGSVTNLQLGYDLGSSVTLTQVRMRSDWWSKRPATWQVWVGQSATDVPGAGAVQVFNGAAGVNPYRCVTGEACTSEVPDACCPDGRDHVQDTRNVGTFYSKFDDATFAATSGRYWYIVVPSTRQHEYLDLADIQFYYANCWE